MWHHLWDKMKEAMITIIPVILIVLVLSATPIVNLTVTEIIVFVVSAILIIVGIAFFSLGADMAMYPVGEQIGSTLVKTKKLVIVLALCFVLGLVITISEPDLSELMELAEPLLGENGVKVTTATVGISTGLFLVFAIIRLLKNRDINLLLVFFYAVLFALICIVVLLGKEKFLPLLFDTGGITTGAISTPFIMAVGIGAAATIGGRRHQQNSFGFIAICSAAPMILGCFVLMFVNVDGNKMDADSMHFEMAESFGQFFKQYGKLIIEIGVGVFITLAIVMVCFIVINHMFMRFPAKKKKQIWLGILYTFIGSVLFLTASSLGFHPIGYKLGIEIANANPVLIAVVGFLLGMFVVLAEPPVHLLAHQVEEVTTGSVSKKAILIALSIGVGISVCLSMIRIIFDFSILYYLVPGYIIALVLSIFMPKIYTAIAFDSGGVASGPITLSFIVPFAMGACCILTPNDIAGAAFGIVAMVAMTPLIAIQLLGFGDVLRKMRVAKIRMKIIEDADDERIIRFK